MAHQYSAQRNPTMHTDNPLGPHVGMLTDKAILNPSLQVRVQPLSTPVNLTMTLVCVQYYLTICSMSISYFVTKPNTSMCECEKAIFLFSFGVDYADFVSYFNPPPSLKHFEYV